MYSKKEANDLMKEYGALITSMVLDDGTTYQKDQIEVMDVHIRSFIDELGEIMKAHEADRNNRLGASLVERVAFEYPKKSRVNQKNKRTKNSGNLISRANEAYISAVVDRNRNGRVLVERLDVGKSGWHDMVEVKEPNTIPDGKWFDSGYGGAYYSYPVYPMNGQKIKSIVIDELTKYNYDEDDRKEF